MCRNIRLLHHFEPPTTPDEVRAAALQYVRKVSGVREPGRADTAAFEGAVDAIAAVTTQLLLDLPARGAVRTREGERDKAKRRFASRAARLPRP